MGSYLNHGTWDTFSKLSDHDTASPSVIHWYVRTAVLKRLGRDALRQKLLAMLEEEFRAAIRTWSQHESVDIKNASGMVI